MSEGTPLQDGAERWSLRSDQLLELMKHAPQLYYRLIVVVGPVGSGKTKLLRWLSNETDTPLINLNVELSRRLLDLTVKERRLKVARIFTEIVAEADLETVLLDNLELLFDVELRVDPLQLLKKASRNRTIVAAWNGLIEKGHLTYARPEHPEYCRYPVGDLLVVDLTDGGGS